MPRTRFVPDSAAVWPVSEEGARRNFHANKYVFGGESVPFRGKFIDSHFLRESLLAAVVWFAPSGFLV
jgi:hypothetical protein